jgi:hypothetical protein
MHLRSVWLVRKSALLAFIMVAAVTAVLSAGAQSKYSLNAVGYADARLVAGSNLFSNPLNAGNNSLSNLFSGLPTGSVYRPWNAMAGQYEPAYQFTAESGWSGAETIQLRRVDAGFLWLPEQRTISFVGEPWPTICLVMPPGFSATGVIPKYNCGLCVNDCLGSWPDVQMYRWDRDRQELVSSENLIQPWWVPDESGFTLALDEAVMFGNFGFASSGRSVGPSGLIGGVTLQNPQRIGSQLVFEFPAYEGLHYSIQQSDDLAAGTWRTISNAVTTTASAPIPVRVPITDGRQAFFRLYSVRLVNPVRVGTQFQFQFQGNAGVRYTVQRTGSLETPAWTTISTVDGTGGALTVTDSAATAAVGYYRLMFE